MAKAVRTIWSGIISLICRTQQPKLFNHFGIKLDDRQLCGLIGATLKQVFICSEPQPAVTPVSWRS
jgi:hypothetical protein